MGYERQRQKERQERKKEICVGMCMRDVMEIVCCTKTTQLHEHAPRFVEGDVAVRADASQEELDATVQQDQSKSAR